MPRFAANLSWMFQELNMSERFAAARALGFEAVEIRLPYDHAPADLARGLNDAGLELIMFNAPPGDMDAGEYGIACLPGREEEFQGSIKAALDYATVLKCGALHVLAGIVPEDADRDHYQGIYEQNLAWAAETCGKVGVGILIEPINTIEKPGYLITLTAEARATCERVGHENLGIQFDFHNAQLMEGNLTHALQTSIGFIRHMQVAGVPGRTPPGEGEMNYAYLFRLIDRLGYTGWVGCEYAPPGKTAESLGWAAEFGLG